MVTVLSVVLPSATECGIYVVLSAAVFPYSRQVKYMAWAGPAPAAMAFTPRIGLMSNKSRFTQLPIFTPLHEKPS